MVRSPALAFQSLLVAGSVGQSGSHHALVLFSFLSFLARQVETKTLGGTSAGPVRAGFTRRT